jgi:hypothetical protein
MELEELEEAEMRFTVTREGGTTYTMAVPVYKAGLELDGLEGPGAPGEGEGEGEGNEEDGAPPAGARLLGRASRHGTASQLPSPQAC